MLSVGTVLQGRYRIAAHLGGGGFGDVYRAWHLSLNAPLAIKEMTPQPGLDASTLAKLRAQFQQEAAVLAYLDHPHLARVTDYFEESGNAYLVMRLVEGETLADLIARQGALPEAQVLAWADQLLDALAYCHGRGVVHRDVKPQNVIVRPDGQAVLVGFGLVKLWDPDDPRTRTAIRGMGTPEYAPPEQRGVQPGHTDPRSDIYSVGAMLYHALTGQAPITASDRTAAVTPFPGVRELNPQVSLQTEAAVDRAMALRIPDRFRDAAEMRAALGRVKAAAPAPARMPPPRQATRVMPGVPAAARPWWRRVPAWGWAAGGVMGVCLLALYAALALGQLLPGLAVTPVPTVTPVPLVPTMPPATLPANPSLGDTWIRPVDGMVMVYVPAGEFQMGSEDGGGDERPVHTVALDGFWIDRTEVTNAQYQKCVAAGACMLPWRQSSYTRLSYYDDPAYADYPVIYVAWYQAKMYAKWVGGWLPTEAEWEYAARGPEGYTYPWGDEAPDCDKANSWGKKDGRCVGDTAAVGSYPAGASWVGALDMAGNVWEWTADWYGPYSSGRQVNPTGPASEQHRAVRGGAFLDYAMYVRCAFRDRHNPYSGGSYDLGFRVVVSPD